MVKWALLTGLNQTTVENCGKMGVFDRTEPCKFCISPQFWASNKREVTRGLSPAGVNQTHPA